MQKINNINKKILSIILSQGRSKLELIRSVYFSLFGSSALNYVINLSDKCLFQGALFLFGVIALFIGLTVSVKIVTDYEMHEKAYESFDKKIKDKYGDSFINYVLKKESDNVLQYYFYISMLFVALICIALSSYIRPDLSNSV